MKFIFYIFRGMLSLNCQKLIELVLSDRLYMDTFGILECTGPLFHICDLDDPDINISMAKYKYRTFLRERVSFINTVNVQSPEVLDSIHLNFRLIFLRDTAAARWIDEATYELLMNVVCAFSPPE